MDQILADWVGRILEWWNEDHPKDKPVTKEDVKSWDMTDVLKGGEGHYFIRSCMRYPEFYRDLEPIPGAIEGVKELVDKGHDVVIATAMPSSAPIAFVGKMEWLRRNMPFFPTQNLIAIKRKELLEGDVLFDDGLHNIEAWDQAGKQAVVLDCPWNRKPVYFGVQRVFSWKEFLHFVERYTP
jgi:5'-nucleotidase